MTPFGIFGTSAFVTCTVCCCLAMAVATAAGLCWVVAMVLAGTDGRSREEQRCGMGGRA